MAKIKLGSRPASFSKVVKFPMLDGTEGAIKVDFKYRTRSEFGKFVDEAVEANAEPDAVVGDPEEKFSLAKVTDKSGATNAEYILKIANGWDLDDEFNLDNALKLCDELPAAATAIMQTYRAAIVEGRLGN